MLENQDVDQRLRDIQREYLDFLDDEVKMFLFAALNSLLFTCRRIKVNMPN